MGRENAGRQARMQAVAVLPKLAHRSQYGDAAGHILFGAEALERSSHGCRIGIVALVDQQHFAAVDLYQVALAAAFEPAEVRERKPGKAHVGTDRLDGREDREGIRHPMLAALWTA